jgi:hypothetical protein
MYAPLLPPIGAQLSEKWQDCNATGYQLFTYFPGSLCLNDKCCSAVLLCLICLWNQCGELKRVRTKLHEVRLKSERGASIFNQKTWKNEMPYSRGRHQQVLHSCKLQHTPSVLDNTNRHQTQLYLLCSSRLLPMGYMYRFYQTTVRQFVKKK